MSELNQFIQETEDILKVVESQKEIAINHRQTSHERLFKLILNVCTLALTGWVAIVAWNPEGFENFKTEILCSSAFLVVTLGLIALSDLLIIVHSWLLEIAIAKHHAGWLKTKGVIERNKAAIKGEMFQTLVGMTKKLMNNTALELDKSTSSTTKRSKAILAYSLMLGMTGTILFFISISMSLYFMTNYVSYSQSVKNSHHLKNSTQSPLPPSSN